jgi:hypothetical protein
MVVVMGGTVVDVVDVGGTVVAVVGGVEVVVLVVVVADCVVVVVVDGAAVGVVVAAPTVVGGVVVLAAGVDGTVVDDSRPGVPAPPDATALVTASPPWLAAMAHAAVPPSPTRPPSTARKRRRVMSDGRIDHT